MHNIISSIERQMRGQRVADLQNALKPLLERGLLFAQDDAARREQLPASQREQARQFYGSATVRLVAHFQKERLRSARDGAGFHVVSSSPEAISDRGRIGEAVLECLRNSPLNSSEARKHIYGHQIFLRPDRRSGQSRWLAEKHGQPAQKRA